MVQRMTNDSQAQPNSTVGDTSEQQVLEEAARSFQEWAERLPAESAWRETFLRMAAKATAGVEVSQMMQEVRARRAA